MESTPIQQAPSPASSTGTKPVRWSWAVAIAVLGLISIFIIRAVPHRSEQHVIMDIGKAIAATLAALLLWLLFASRLRWKIRLAVLAAFLGAIALVAGLFRIRGVSGDLVPILEPRWATRSLAKPEPQSTSAKVQTVEGAAEFTQFFGPQRDGKLDGPKLGTNWNTNPPRQLWRQPIGTAWSGFVVSGSLAVTQEQRGEDELTIAYDLLTGKPVWSHATQARYVNSLAGEGPRATPLIHQGRVYSQGSLGMFTCLNLQTGKLLWNRDVLKENQAGVPSWGHSSSPLALGNWIIVNAAGRSNRSLIAYNSTNGEPVWNGGDVGDTYSSPITAKLDGLQQVILFAGPAVGHDATTGQELWRFPWPGGHPHIATPLILNETDLLISSGYGTGSARIQVRRGPDGKWSATQVWRTNRLKSKFANPVLFNGHIYGLDDGIMACIDAETGELKWKDGRYGHGQLLLVAGTLLVMAESGEVLLVDPNPQSLRELCRFQALAGKTWNPHCLAGEYLLVRNDKEAACYRLPVASN